MGKYTERNKKEKNSIRLFVNKIKEDSGCAICGEKNPDKLTFHHVDKDDKEYKISDLVVQRRFNLLTKELRKCIVLCYDCHRKVHSDDELYEQILESFNIIQKEKIE